MKVLRNLVATSAVLMLIAVSAAAQCETWNNSPKQSDAMGAHSVYRGIVKGKTYQDLAKIAQEDFNIAMENWSKAYEIAPAADGNRASHFFDGVELLKAKRERVSDKAEKEIINERIVGLYDQLAECYPDKKAQALGRKATDMFYMSNHGYRTSTLDAFRQAINEGGKKLEYIVFEPLGQTINYLFKKDKIEQQEAQDLLVKAQEIAEHQAANAPKNYQQYYESAKSRMMLAVRETEDDIFDCSYFREKLMPSYKKYPDSLQVLRYVYTKLKKQGCDTSAQFMAELKADYEQKATEVNAAKEAEFLANNPSVAAKRAYDEENFEEAIKLYEEAIENVKEEDGDKEKIGEYLFAIASIQFRKLDRYSEARSTAREAAQYKSGWGRPYMLIGDMYATSSRSCGNDGYTRGLAVLAAIDKYRYAKSIDSDVADEADRKIGLYNGSIPTQDMVFMRGKDGATETVPCWIGETVKVRYQ